MNWLSRRMAGVVRMKLTPVQLAKDLDRDATPDFKVTLVTELFRRDPALEAEIAAVLSDPRD